ncbi:MAG: NAD(P)-binding domain-containing protein, partial [Patescibacteria group bacterium]
MKLGYLGLGKMGYSMVARLREKGHEIVSYDPSEEARVKTAELGVTVVDSYAAVVAALEAPCVILSMIPHAAVDDMLTSLVPLLSPDDLIVDGANSPYEQTVRRAGEVTATGVHFLEMGVSGGPGGARTGACLMIGGEREDYERLLPLIKDIAKGEGYYTHLGPAGAGHYAKMIHNGIEYGMMQAIGEG